jgi:succinoglycan biosynthesis protein ExoL
VTLIRPAQRAVIVSTASSQPRYHRRASALLSAGFDVTVYTFSRGYYELNKYPAGARVVDLGRLENGSYLGRVPRLLGAVRRIRKAERAAGRPASVVYTFGLDAALIGSLVPGAGRVVYEVGDLRNPTPQRSALTRLLHRAETHAIRKVDLLVTTSPAFVREYFRQMDPNIGSRTLVVENKLFQQDLGDAGRRPVEPVVPRCPLRIGFVGFLRYPRTVLPLLEAVARRGDSVEFHVHGDGPLRETVEEFARRAANVHYHGPFRNPDALPGIYASIDLNYVVYDNSDRNVQLALPNKLYESLFYGVPVVVAAGTELSHRVREWSAGFVIDPARSGFVDEFLDEMTQTPEAITLASECALAVSSGELVDDGRALVSRLTGLASTRPDAAPASLAS